MQLSSITPENTRTDGWHRTIFVAIDAVCTAEGSPPPGTFPRLFGALDSLRAALPDSIDAEQGERIAVTVHHLQAILPSGRKARSQVTAIRSDLRRTALRWLDTMPLSAFA